MQIARPTSLPCLLSLKQFKTNLFSTKNLRQSYKCPKQGSIGKYLPLRGGRDISRCHLGKKIWKGYEQKRESVKEKGRMGKENEKRGSKRVKQMQNREQLRSKGHDGSQKTTCCKRGKISFSERGGGGGINIVFGPKYRPLVRNMVNYGTDIIL